MKVFGLPSDYYAKYEGIEEEEAEFFFDSTLELERQEDPELEDRLVAAELFLCSCSDLMTYLLATSPGSLEELEELFSRDLSTARSWPYCLVSWLTLVAR